jgi:hypothetical protein
VTSDDPNWWSCPFCGGPNPFDAATCSQCNAQLRDSDDDDLFTTVAVDNAEVVPPDPPFGRDNMWSTAAPVADPFSPEPVVRPADVVDEPAEDLSVPVFDGPTVFSRTGFTTGPVQAAPATTRPTAVPTGMPVSVPPAAGAEVFGGRMPPPLADANGLAAAVSRLRPEAQEEAAIPFSVCGALLAPGEIVMVAVNGQMLGHPAIVVLTNERVLVINARRWQPIVDVFAVGPELVVRGRHDRDVASLTFSEGARLSTVDGISEVGLAVELADRLRGSG